MPTLTTPAPVTARDLARLLDTYADLPLIAQVIEVDADGYEAAALTGESGLHLEIVTGQDGIRRLAVVAYQDER